MYLAEKSVNEINHVEKKRSMAYKMSTIIIKLMLAWTLGGVVYLNNVVNTLNDIQVPTGVKDAETFLATVLLMIYTLTQISNLRLENKKKKLDIEEQEKRLKHPNQNERRSKHTKS